MKKKSSPEPTAPPQPAVAPTRKGTIEAAAASGTPEKPEAKPKARQRAAPKAPPPRTLSRTERRQAAEREAEEREREERRAQLMANAKTGGAYIVTLLLVTGLSWWLIAVL